MKEAGLAKPQVFEEEEVRKEKAQNQEAGSLEPSVWVGGIRTPSMVSSSTPALPGEATSCLAQELLYRYMEDICLTWL